MPTNPVELTVLEAYVENQGHPDDIAMASELIDAREEIAMLKKHCPFEEELASLRSQVAAMGAPVSDEEWRSMGDSRLARNQVNALIAARKAGAA